MFLFRNIQKTGVELLNIGEDYEVSSDEYPFATPGRCFIISTNSIYKNVLNFVKMRETVRYIDWVPTKIGIN